MGKYAPSLYELECMGFNIWGGIKYPIFDEAYRHDFQKKIQGHYYWDEIGFDNPVQFQQRLENKLQIIMPRYNQMYLSTLIEFDPLNTEEYVEIFNRDQVMQQNVGAASTAFTQSKENQSNQEKQRSDIDQTNDTVGENTKDQKDTETFTGKEKTHQDTQDGKVTENITDRAIGEVGKQTEDKTQNSESNKIGNATIVVNKTGNSVEETNYKGSDRVDDKIETDGTKTVSTDETQDNKKVTDTTGKVETDTTGQRDITNTNMKLISNTPQNNISAGSITNLTYLSAAEQDNGTSKETTTGKETANTTGEVTEQENKKKEGSDLETTLVKEEKIGNLQKDYFTEVVGETKANENTSNNSTEDTTDKTTEKNITDTKKDTTDNTTFVGNETITGVLDKTVDTTSEKVYNSSIKGTDKSNAKLNAVNNLTGYSSQNNYGEVSNTQGHSQESKTLNGTKFSRKETGRKNRSPAELIRIYREVLINVDEMVIRELGTLFRGVL